MFCTECQFHENKDFLCLLCACILGTGMVTGIFRLSATLCQENERGLCTEMLCDWGQGSCEPSTGLWQSSGQQAGVLDGPPGCPASEATSQGHADARRLKWPVRDRRVATRTPGPICASPTCDTPSGHAALNTRKEEGHPRIHRATEAE